MDDDVVRAIITQLRTITGITALVGTRIYPAAQVPPDAPFPRGYVGQAAGGTDQWSDGGQYDTRLPWFSVEWVTRTIESPTANKDVQTLDALANTALRGTISLPNLTYLRRYRTLRPEVQDNDNVEYISGGGLWIALREYSYS
jgi:hypothetical protein